MGRLSKEVFYEKLKKVFLGVPTPLQNFINYSPIDRLKNLHGLRALHRLGLLHKLGLLQVLLGRQRALAEGALKEVPRPLQGVLDLVGEVLEGADGDALLRGILGRAVRLGHVGDDDLCVWKRARLEELWDLGQEVQGDYGSQ